MLYLANKSVFLDTSFLIGNNLISFRDGDISWIHNFSFGLSYPTLLLRRVISVLKIPLLYPASLINLSASIKYSFGNWKAWS
jgi:hypothetical protein